MIEINTKDISGAVRIGKVEENKERPLVITMVEEMKKREIFLNLNKLRATRKPFNNVAMTHDLTVKQKKRTERTDKRSK